MLKTGDKAPKAVATDSEGNAVDFERLWNTQGLVVYFYPGDFTPVCTKQACLMRDARPDFGGVAVVGISEGLFTQLKTVGSTVGISCLCPGWVNTKIADSDRNRPEWAAPDALDEPSEAAEARFAMIREELASGRSPDDVADLVHDAIVSDSFWIFTDLGMVAALEGRFNAVLGNENPNWDAGLLGAAE